MQAPSQQAADTMSEVFQPSGFNMVQLLLPCVFAFTKILSGGVPTNCFKTVLIKDAQCCLERFTLCRLGLVETWLDPGRMSLDCFGFICCDNDIPVVPHKAVAEVSEIGNLQERLVVVNQEWQSESTDGSKGGWSLKLSIYLSILSTHLAIYLSVCLSI